MGKVKKKKGRGTELCPAFGTQHGTEGGNQARLERKGRAKSWEGVRVIPECLNATLTLSGVGGRCKTQLLSS